MKIVFLRVLKISVIFYLLMCSILFFLQEKLIFFPEKLDKSYRFSFEQKFEELHVKTEDKKLLHGLLFISDSSQGLIFYLHGNAGSLRSWGEVAKTYTDLNYDVFMLDYRGYGKSEGAIKSQEQLFGDLQVAYDEMKKRYSENKIIILGYSIGTGPAAKIASVNQPRLLILQAPYYSLTDITRRIYPIVPTFLLKYKFDTYKYIKDSNVPIIIFHGDRDEVIYYGSSLKLKEQLKSTDKLITLNGQRHNGITDNPEYKREIQKILSESGLTPVK